MKRTRAPMIKLVRDLKAQEFKVRRDFPANRPYKQWDFVLTSHGMTLVPLNHRAASAVKQLVPSA